MTQASANTAQEADPRGRAGVLFGALASLPLVETLIYNAHVAPGLKQLPAQEYLLVGAMALLLVTLHTFCFIIPEGMFKRVLSAFRRNLEETRARLRDYLSFVLLALPIFFLVVFFGGAAGVKLLKESGVLEVALLPPFLFGFVVVLIWAISKVIATLGRHADDLSGGMSEWAFSMRLSASFYILLVAATLRLLSFEGIHEDARLEFSLGIAKDYLLMFIIAGMLFTGLYKIGKAKSLRAIFQSQKGLFYFVLICGLIAIMAIAADFAGMSAANQDRIFIEPWQKRMNTVHVYGRDIGLLLLPIAGLLFWSLKRVALEAKEP